MRKNIQIKMFWWIAAATLTLISLCCTRIYPRLSCPHAPPSNKKSKNQKQSGGRSDGSLSATRSIDSDEENLDDNNQKNNNLDSDDDNDESDDEKFNNDNLDEKFGDESDNDTVPSTNPSPPIENQTQAPPADKEVTTLLHQPLLGDNECLEKYRPICPVADQLNSNSNDSNDSNDLTLETKSKTPQMFNEFRGHDSYY